MARLRLAPGIPVHARIARCCRGGEARGWYIECMWVSLFRRASHRSHVLSLISLLPVQLCIWQSGE